MVNPPNPQRPDLEDLVAFLEGRGSEAMRVLVLKRLDEDPDYLATMNDLVPMLREAGLIPAGGIAPASPEIAEPEPKPNVIGNPSRFRRRTGLIAIAAALGPISIGLWLLTSRVVPFASRVAQELGASPAHLKAEVWEKGGTRGDGDDPESSSPQLPDDSDLPLVGAQIFDLTLAVNKRDLAAASAKTVALNHSLGEYADGTYGGVEDKLEAAPLVWDDVDAEMKEADHYLKQGLDDKKKKLVDKGTCLRAAFLAQQAGNPDFAKSWPDACGEALKGQDLQTELQKMREQFGPLSDDFELDEDGAAEAPPG